MNRITLQERQQGASLVETAFLSLFIAVLVTSSLHSLGTSARVAAVSASAALGGGTTEGGGAPDCFVAPEHPACSTTPTGDPFLGSCRS